MTPFLRPATTAGAALALTASLLLATSPTGASGEVAGPRSGPAPEGSTPAREPRVEPLRTSDVAMARRATARFRSVARAVEAGYALPPEGPLHQCITDYADQGAMGFHFIHPDLASDTDLDPRTPEALVYHRDERGRVRLGALEYVVPAEAWDRQHDGAPHLMGQDLMRVDAPNRYELPDFYMLHAWLWKQNPAGRFSPYNSRVSCHADEPPTPQRAAGPAAGPVSGADPGHEHDRDAAPGVQRRTAVPHGAR